MIDWDADHDRALSRHLARDEPGDCECPEDECTGCEQPGRVHQDGCWADGMSIRDLDCTGRGYEHLAGLYDGRCESCRSRTDSEMNQVKRGLRKLAVDRVISSQHGGFRGVAAHLHETLPCLVTTTDVLRAAYHAGITIMEPTCDD